MSVPRTTPAFSETVAEPRWWQDASDWVDDALAQAGVRPRGRLTQRRVRPWSTHAVVPTDHGPVWFKAGCAAMRFEPALQEALARLVPSVQAPLAVEPVRGWMLTMDHGPALGDEHRAADWHALIAVAAQTQRALTAHGPALRATGLPDGSPPVVPERFDQLLDALGGLPRCHPSALNGQEAEVLRARRSALLEACAALQESPVPVTFQHGDLHLHNAYRDDRLRLFDFGDAQWASAVEILRVPYAIIRRGEEPHRWDELVARYLAVWDVDHTAFGVAWNAAHFTHAVNRAFTWWRCLRTATPHEWARWGEAPLAHLREMIRP